MEPVRGERVDFPTPLAPVTRKNTVRLSRATPVPRRRPDLSASGGDAAAIGALAGQPRRVRTALNRSGRVVRPIFASRNRIHQWLRRVDSVRLAIPIRGLLPVRPLMASAAALEPSDW
jgi:hypothetical protein